MKITLIGTGNVAFHLGKRFKEKGIILNQIIGRNKEKTAWLSEVLFAPSTVHFSEIQKDSDIYIIAVSDSAIEDVAQDLSQMLDNQWVVHTSGTIASTILAPYFSHYGTLYPLQTFTLNTDVDFEKIPIFINASISQIKTEHDPSLLFPIDFLEKTARLLSPKIYVLSDEKRIALHVAAVFVNNFTNYLFQIGKTIMDENGLPFDVLKPLIEQTVIKIHNQEPNDVQTGPAIRGDWNTIEKHLDFLKNHPPQYQAVYKLLSESIAKKNY
jgi:predicted short-subunit dehydrogenase-like oxidoreductase (DUF2520 family)